MMAEKKGMKLVVLSVVSRVVLKVDLRAMLKAGKRDKSWVSLWVG